MGDRLSQFYDCGRSACLLAIFTLGEPESLFQEQVHQMLHDWINSLALVLTEAGIPSKEARQRAEDAVIQVQGALVLTRDSTALSLLNESCNNFQWNCWNQWPDRDDFE